MLHMLVAVFVLVGRLLGPAVAAQMPGPGEFQLTGAGVICHSGDSTASSVPDQGKRDGHAPDCQLCPACHLITLAVLPDAGPSVISAAAVVHADRPALPPPSTGPPHPVRLAARPTGPPSTVI